ncbi:MAG TPA: hypothetical protein PKC67_14985 [Kiritimatiellia bacterium]|nr:hypothetical protein [Kiritimatiellia bacterium]HMP35639.1 hypothetical protein [Kiritimatiellia bacterium]
MPSLVIKNLPPALHRRLKEDARDHHRSMTQQAIVLLENGLLRTRSIPAAKAYKGTFPLTDTFLQAAKREGRA